MPAPTQCGCCGDPILTKIYKIEWIDATSDYFTNPAYGDHLMIKMEKCGYGVGNLVTREVDASMVKFLMPKRTVRAAPFDYAQQVREDYNNAIGMP